jgi:Putative transposase DNA-binding domain
VYSRQVLGRYAPRRRQRCAWQQACGIVQSWFSNARENRPLLRSVCIQANANVVLVQRSHTPTFDYWLRISTLEKGSPVWVPLRLYRNAQAILKAYDRLCSGVTLNRRDGQWYATLVVERRTRKAQATHVVGCDIGMKAVVTTSTGNAYGELGCGVQERLQKTDAKRTRKQKLNACLEKKALPTVNLRDHRAEMFVRNGVGQALNQMLDALPPDCAVALERLSVRDMRFKSRQLNRLLKTHQLGFIRDRLQFKLDEWGIRYRSVQAAYSSQRRRGLHIADYAKQLRPRRTCSRCGFTFALNRRSQATFQCLWCDYAIHADVNAARNIAERFGDDALNALPFRHVETLLALRFMARLPAARSAAAGRDTLPNVVLDSTQLVPPPGQSPPLNKNG